ncbi:MAG TPA: hypothetical protein EYN79_09380 [Planctomycetes bacterium]|nr:hypothetical protein [Planctomycetota bacterium]HIN80923.1 hypothetical protein [Planctomycetota bacterium]
MKLRSPPILLVMIFLLLASELWACKYSVRDVGFVNLGSRSYRLYIFKATGTGRSASLPPFEESNVIAEPVIIGEEHPAAGYLGRELVAGEEVALLIAPDGRSLTVDLDDLDSILDSPVRELLLKKILRAHSILLVVEGKDARQNALALAATEEAIVKVTSTMDSLPKPIDKPPLSIVIPLADRARERVLLWGLGIDPDDSGAHVAVLIGRCRRLGPVLSFPGTEEGQLQRNLQLIGQDCECGLDTRWMQGPMAPHRWDSVQQARAVMALGFDAMNPMVQVEIRRILARQVARAAEVAGGSGLTDPLVGYEEVTLDNAPISGEVTGPVPLATPRRGLALWFLLGLSLAALLGGVFIFLIATKREQR